MRDDQAARYARHVSLPGLGERGQAALLGASARLPADENDELARLTAAAYLAAGGVGTLVMPSVGDEQRAELHAYGPDTRILRDGAGQDVVLVPPPAWWPACEGDGVALAFWRGGIAAAAWMIDAVSR